MVLENYKFDGSKKYSLNSVKTNEVLGVKSKAEGLRRLEENIEKIAVLQARLYSEATQTLLVVLQAMDAAGKDGTVRHVFSGVSPDGVWVTSFKQPSSEELARDYLWRIHKEMPPRGCIGVFNRSHYEDVLVAKVLDLPKTQKLPKRTQKNIWQNRYRQISDFERYLNENGTTIVKINLHISQQEQARRFLSRLDDTTKNWKFSMGDIDSSSHWDEYMKAYRDAINGTAAPHAPWYVVPADKKWYARLIVSEIVLDALEKMKPGIPVLTKEQKEEMAKGREILQEWAAERDVTLKKK